MEFLQPSVKIFRLTKITKITMAHKMKKMKGELKNITDQYQNYGFKQGSISSEQQVPDKRETSSKEEEEFIVGRTEEKQTFISSCLSENINKKIVILPIYGIGGIGKTMFAKMVFNNSQFKDYSQTMLNVGIARKVIVIVTTRDKEIAYKICAIEPYKLPPLTDDMCWTIIKQKVDFEARPNNDQLELTVGVHYEDVTLLTMHDLLHDLARYVMVDEILDTSKQGNTGESRCHFVLLNDCTESLRSFTHSPTKIRALRYLESDKNVLCGTSSAKYLRFLVCGKTGFHNDMFSSAKYLHLLDLSECFIQKLPHSIGQLKQLRYLSAPGVQDQKILSSITKLSKLIYLNLCGSVISVLQESVGEMEGVSETLGNLTQLRSLNLSNCINIGEVPEDLGSLTDLRYLNLSCSSFLTKMPYTGVLGTLTKLEYLNLSSLSSDIKRLPNAMGSFIELKYLNLSGCKSIKEIPKSFGKLRKLVHLDLSMCYNAIGIPEVLCSLTKLHYLDLSWCLIELRYGGLPKMMDKLMELRYLNLSGCFDRISRNNRIRRAGPETPTMAQLDMSTLRFSKSSISFPYFVVQAFEGEPCSNIVLLEDVSSPELEISHLDNVKSVEEAHRIKLRGKQSMCTSLPPLGQLRNLKILVFETMPNITKIDGSLCGGVKAFPRLDGLYISNMESLEEWSTTYSDCEDVAEEFMFPNLKYLEISCCRKLRLKPCPSRVEVVWRITDSDVVLSQWGESMSRDGSFNTATLVTYLNVKSSKAPMHYWRLLHYLPALNKLFIKDCNDVSTSPEITVEGNGFGEMLEWPGEPTSLKTIFLKKNISLQIL
uniref:NBS-LRR disease resistance protein n=1 Tax=Oryza officinalis TaxID=4535 RepID=B9V0Q6_9ORYZ|nr:NBS-LRR disease resistance protein [Oryza officinalis]